MTQLPPDPMQLSETGSHQTRTAVESALRAVEAHRRQPREFRFFFSFRRFALAIALLIVVIFGLGYAVGRAAAAPRVASVIPAVDYGPIVLVSSPDESDRRRPVAPHERDAARTAVPSSPTATLVVIPESGLASTYGPGYDGLTAARLPKGTVIRICAVRCVIRTVNDYGPNTARFPERIVDLDVATFEEVCDVSWRMGLCTVEVWT